MTVPIVPGPGEPEPTPTPAYPLPYQQPMPAYQAQTAPPPWNPGRAAGNTVVVLLTLVGVFCVLPILGCAVLAIFGSIGR